MRSIKALFLCMTFGLSVGAAQAQPINDNISQAVQIFSGSAVYGQNSGATLEPGEPNFGSASTGGAIGARKTVWFRYQATVDGVAAVVLSRTVAGTSFQRLATDVFDSNVPTTTNRRAIALSEASGFGGIYYRFQFNTTRGVNYYIRVGTAQTSSLVVESSFLLNLVQHGRAGGVTILPVNRTQDGTPLDPVLTNPPTATSAVAVSQFNNSQISVNYSGGYMVINTSPRIQTLTARSSNSENIIELENNSSGVPASAVRFTANIRTSVPGMRFFVINGLPSLNSTGSFLSAITVQTAYLSVVTARRNFAVATHRFNSGAELLISMGAANRSLSAQLGRLTGTTLTIENRSTLPARGCRILQPYNANTNALFVHPSYSYTWRLVGGQYGATFDIVMGTPVNVQLLLRPNFVGSINDIGIEFVCNNHRLLRYRIGLSLTGTSPSP